MLFSSSNIFTIVVVVVLVFHVTRCIIMIGTRNKDRRRHDKEVHGSNLKETVYFIHRTLPTIKQTVNQEDVSSITILHRAR